MSPDAELMLIFGTLHLIAVALGALLFVMFLRSEATKPWQPPDEDEGGGGGGNDRLPQRPPTSSPPGGLPLPDAVPAVGQAALARAPARPHAAARAPPGARAGAAAPPRPALAAC